MLFNSLDFLVFFPIFFVIYILGKTKYRWLILLFASYYFYAYWKPEYLLLILLSTVIDYTCGIKISESDDEKRRRFYLKISIIFNLSILLIFKYSNFFITNINDLLLFAGSGFVFKEHRLDLPVGISFYTFQTMSYTIDIFRRHVKAERNILRFSLYVSFFPQLVAGPIERSYRLLPQLKENFVFNLNNLKLGLLLVSWGLIKKIVIADHLAFYVDAIYNNVYDYQGIALIIATVFFAFQIYCDFSGYSDIAIGLAQILGIKLMKNFNMPYFANSISDFWKRWHISLSTWFRDYLYIPLGGNRKKKYRVYINLLTVFVVSGFWHGANWTFLIWGFLHGFYLIFAISFKPYKEALCQKLKITRETLFWKTLSRITVFSLVCFAWIFFRANSVSDAFYIVQNLFVMDPNFQVFDFSSEIAGRLSRNFPLYALFLLIFVSLQIWARNKNVYRLLLNSPWYQRWTIYMILFFTIIFFHADSGNFIYFQF